LIIGFEMLLWPRKKARALRIGRTKIWMIAHIWLGLLCLPLLVLHSGFRWWGGALSGVLMVLLLIVIVSGVVGLVLQQYLPRRMLDEVPAETIYSQIDYILTQFRDEADRLVRATCGTEGPGSIPEASGAAEVGGEQPSYLVIGAVRSAGRVQGKVLETRVQATRVPGCEPLQAVYRDTIGPFLAARSGRRMTLGTRNRASTLFRDLKTKVPSAAHPVVDTLESLCDQRRQLDEQARLHAWLHAWLCVHQPVSVALFVLMLVHVFVALEYL
jgi:hypothetical protein